MRKKIYEVIEPNINPGFLNKIYGIFMLICIVVSIYPLVLRDNSLTVRNLEIIIAIIFSVDYVLRLITADYKLNKGKASFLIYPFTFMALIDLISILPVFGLIHTGFKMFRVVRFLRTLKVVTVFRTFRYSKNIEIIGNVFKRQKNSLTTVGILALGYIFLTAIIMFNVEPQTFDTFFDALYWATISLMTVGYGDIYATTVVGRSITMISSLVGVAIVALPSGILTAGYMEEIREREEK